MLNVDAQVILCSFVISKLKIWICPLQGLHPVNKETACQLGALQSQVQYGDFPENKPKFYVEFVSFSSIFVLWNFFDLVQK